jgi:hypothetical protein
MKKVIVFNDGSCILKDTVTGSSKNFESVHEYESSPHYHPSIPINTEAQYINSLPSFSSQFGGIVKAAKAETDVLKARPNFLKVMKALEGFLPKGHSMSWVPAVEFDEQVFADAPDDYKELGCSPDWNAWEEDLNPPPYCEDRPFLRTASGHIHIGWGENYSLDDALHQRNCFDFVKQLDWYLGGWSLKHDSDPTRRTLYGRARSLSPEVLRRRVSSP